MDISQEEILSVVMSHLLQASEEVKRDFIESYARNLFPLLGTSVDQTRWWTQYGITRVTVWGHNHFRNNVRVAMIEEALGLGPRYYYILRSELPEFSDRVYLLAQFLPHEKFVLHPAWGPPLGGPFSNSPQAIEMGAAISARRIPLEERPFFCFICHERFCDHMMDEVFGGAFRMCNLSGFLSIKVVLVLLLLSHSFVSLFNCKILNSSLFS